ncbi:hypothetical protein NM688_g680 [Phlebia brevispora]|uniref:Uncharacterized protein n=1 Tax=Phlebia brevispora TaxID=194682 RepID=A0ACC1TDN4_9APHY|nr:hypothetical protein NM688_g680 [Phlebia brevispora]
MQGLTIITVYHAWLVMMFMFAAILLRLTVAIARTYRLMKIMPPGPPGLPLLGNVLQIGQLQWLRFTEWKQQYGPIFSLNLAGQLVIVLNDFETAADLVDRRSAIYSDRPRFIMASEILTGGLLIAFVSCGNLWRRLRRAAHDGLNARASVAYQPLQEKESAQLLVHMLKDPENWDVNLKRSAASMVLCGVYGWLSVDETATGFIQRITQLMKRITCACLPGAYLVEIFPFMLYLPAWTAKWKREGSKWYQHDTRMLEGVMADVGAKLRAGTSEPSFAATLIENETRWNLTRREAAWLAGTMVGAGQGSIAGSLTYFVLAMVLYLDVMRRAQEQVDEVVGRARLPRFSDREKLPYVEAMVKEVLRWRSVGPAGLPRCSTQDDWYKGYFIPKGTLIILNVWGMNRDPAYFPDYDDFRPERYLGESGDLCDPVPDTHGQGHLSFGAGKRICVGKDLANQALFINMAAMLWAFDMKPAVDANGEAIIPSRTECIDEGLVVRPVPFKCAITPRTADVPEIVAYATEAYACGEPA